MDDLEDKLKAAQARRFRLIATDGVFSMDGNTAPLNEILDLAQRYDALVMVDECHSAGVVGNCGRGITELFGRMGEVDIITGTLGKAFGGAIGGFTTGRKEIIEFLRQRSRPYLFSNTLPPAVAGAGIRAFDMLSDCTDLQDKLRRNTSFFVDAMQAAGFELKPTQSAICAVMIYDARLTQECAARLLEEGIYVIGFSFPVVPRQQARIRVQLSAAHDTADLERAVAAFSRVGRELGVVSN
jgi:glycine C-acetyltransferase